MPLLLSKNTSPPTMRWGWVPSAVNLGLGTVDVSVPKIALGAAPRATRFSAALLSVGRRYSTLLAAPMLKLSQW